MIRTPALALLATSIAHAVPEGFEIHPFAAPFDADYPAAITVAPNGDVYVSSDQNGSLGKAPDMGRIIRCRDTDGDGKADQFIHFVPKINSPRGGHIIGDTLYLIHPPYLSSFRDKDGDGVAEESKVLVTGLGGGIEHPRGADHTTNGVRMGIDGWLYISVGDFGTTPAKGTDGSSVTLHGGGVLRVRPDGSEVEAYSVMTRNICDTAISPTLDLFSRDNTNDGKGWNTRFHHYTALSNHGYPRLYQHFADEAVKPLADYGGGSGTGMLWVDEPGFPGKFGKMLYSCDWTTGNVYAHPSKQAGASFEVQQEIFEKVGRATDIDVDGFSRLYIADWRGGSFNYAGKGKPVGMIQQVVPTGTQRASYRDVTKAKATELVELLASPSAVQRFEAQREMIARGKPADFATKVLALATDAGKPLEVRVAAIFTVKQLLGKQSTPQLAKLTADAAVREYALRAMTDRTSELDGVPVDAYTKALTDSNPRVVLQALIGLQRLKASQSSSAIIAASANWKEEGISPRLQLTAINVLAALADVPSLLKGVESAATRKVCLRALGQLHDAKVVSGLAQVAKSSQDKDLLFDTLLSLARLHCKEATWDFKAWWGTRPDDRGPYFEPVEWEQSATIRSVIEELFANVPKERQGALLGGIAANRIAVTTLKLPGVDPLMAALGSTQPDESQIKLLVEAAKNPKLPFARRVECYQAILRQPSKNSLKPRLEILAVWSKEQGLPAEVGQHVDDFVNETSRGEELKPLREIAAKGSNEVSTLAWKAILTVIKSPLAKDGWKKAAAKLTEETPREVGFFNAIAELKLSGYDKQIEAGLHWDNDELIAAATRAKQATATTQGAGKKVGELQPKEVMDLVMKGAGKGNIEEGKRLFTAQGCIACHAVDPAAVQKGPDLGTAGSKFTRDYLIESILNPNAVVAQGFQTTMLTTKDGQTQMGFITAEADGVIELRNIAGQATKIQRADVTNEQHLPQSMMPPGLAAGLTVEQLNDLVDFLGSMKSK
ncbi:MAG TPA: c-type cytochrome [Luteolibacter sp.]|nr:c-type cytochrome [Luteolibacter sp.]